MRGKRFTFSVSYGESVFLGTRATPTRILGVPRRVLGEVRGQCGCVAAGVAFSGTTN